MENDGSNKRFLVIQTASIGDVILATALIEKLHKCYPEARLDFLVKKGCEGLLQGHPYINKVLIWEKRAGKYRGLFALLQEIRASKYHGVINPHRYFSSGFLTAFSKARIRSGFKQNPLSLFFTFRVAHRIGGSHPLHETGRNQLLLGPLDEGSAAMPALYPTTADMERVKAYQSAPYITVAPCSLWFTKQFPAEKWIAFLNALPQGFKVYLTGSTTDSPLLEAIRQASKGPEVINLAGQLSLLETAALMKGARMNFTNDSAPLHLATATASPLTAIFCSTIPGFGFGPLQAEAVVIETEEPLACRPCGLHGHQRCPERHFKCAGSIPITKLIQRISYER